MTAEVIASLTTAAGTLVLAVATFSATRSANRASRIAERSLPGDVPHAPVDKFRAQTRSLYVPPGGLGFWQGALRDSSDPIYDAFANALKNRDPIS